MTLEAINTVMLSCVSAVIVGAFPWVISVERRLARLCNGGLAGRVDRLEAGQQAGEVRCAANHPRARIRVSE